MACALRRYGVTDSGVNQPSMHNPSIIRAKLDSILFCVKGLKPI
ncbi:MAG: hypothetical protein P8X74_10505 [Reinekea sp.]